MFGGHTTAVAVLLALLAVGWCEGSCIIAENTATPRNLGCNFSVSHVPETSFNCNTSRHLRQVFRLLDVNGENVLVGSTECLYSLTSNLTYEDSVKIDGPDGGAECRQENPAENQDFVCKNYITHGFTTATNSFTVCGTNDAKSPICWPCSRSGKDLTCEADGVTTNFMPTDPIENVTAIMTEDGSQFFIGGRQSANNLGTPAYQISRVNVISGAEELSTNDEDQVINTPVDFVGEPIEHGEFIYMFFREVALEDYLQTTVYSRIARVAKADVGGETNPLSNGFTTYLKTRLMCSCGETYPVVYNEIQDMEAVKNSSGNITFLYGLFTKRNSMSSSSAICRYDMAELVEIFNSANRRGPSDDNINIDNDRTWSERPKRSEDQTEDRKNSGEKYPLDLNLYRHLLRFPLLNINVPNCGLGRLSDECTNGARSSHNALAVFHNLRGQQLTISESDDGVDVFIGTDNLQIVKATINETNAIITEDIRIITKSSSDTSEMHTDLKWPNGITSLTTSNGSLYGNSDTCVFGIPLNQSNCTGVVNERKDDTVANHTFKIHNAVTNFFTVFDAPMGVNMSAGFSGLFNDTICSGERFDAPANNKEVLHVTCRISTKHIDDTMGDVCRNGSDLLEGIITIGQDNCILDTVFKMDIGIDCTEQSDQVTATTVNKYDEDMAKYRFNLTRWQKEQTTCNMDCPAGENCCSATPTTSSP